MQTEPGQSGDAERKKSAIDRLIAEIVARDSGKGRLNESAIVARHPELMPELATALRKLSALRWAQTASMVVQDTVAPAPADPSAPSVTIPGYVIEKELGWGGQAVVYLAVQINTGRKVAIKVMRADALADERALARFQREVRVLAALDHPNIVGILDTGQTGEGNHFIAMNYVSGSTLDEYMQARQRSASSDPAELLRLFLKLCNAVNVAHVRGIVHRDLKPGNIRIDERGEPHVLDFGLAHTPLDRLAGGDHPVAVTGEFLGSLPWCSPEQAEGDPDRIDIRSDVYSLGVILYQMLTGGRFPYEVVGNIRDVLNNILKSEPTPPSKVAGNAAEAKGRHEHGRMGRLGPPAVNETIERIVLKALAKNRELRYQTAGELGRDVEAYLAGQPTTVGGPIRAARRSPMIRQAGIAALLAVAVAVAAIGLWLRKARPQSASAGPALPAAVAPAPATAPAPSAQSPVAAGPDRSMVLIQGSCHLDGDVLVLTPGRLQAIVYFSTMNLSDYDLSFQAMTSGPGDGDGFRVVLHALRGNGCHFWLGRMQNTIADISSKFEGEATRLASASYRIEPDRWYQVKVQTRGPAIHCFVNGQEFLSAADDRFKQGRVGLATFDPGIRFRDLQLTAPDGAILWQGPPDLSRLPAGAVDPPGSTSPPMMGKTDLLRTVDLHTDAPLGRWTESGGGVTGQGESAHLQLRAVLPAEYDYRITFLRTKGDSSIELVAKQNGRFVAWTIGGHKGTIMGFGQVNGLSYDDPANPTQHPLPVSLANGIRHTLVLRVRKDFLHGYIDGQLADMVNGEVNHLSTPPGRAQNDGYPLGIWLGGDEVRIESADVFALTKKPGPGPSPMDR